MHRKKSKAKINLLTVWSFIRNVGYLLTIQIIALIILAGTDQSGDFVMAFVDGKEPGYYISVGLIYFFWSYISWYSASVILQISPVNLEYIDDKLAEKFCLVIGYVPSVILAITFFSREDETKNYSALFGFISLALGIIFILIFKWIDKMNEGRGKWPAREDVFKHNTNNKQQERTPSIREEWHFISRFSNVSYYFKVLGIFFLSVLIILSFTEPLIWLTRSLRPAAVVIYCFTFLTYAVTVLYYFHDIKARPFVMLIIIWLLFCSIFNDNTRIPVTKPFTRLQDFRLTPQQAFEKWYAAKTAAWNASDTGVQQDSSRTMPVIFIATEGGGIRGEIWTSEVLHELTKMFPDFYNQVFCIGGASGGTVGALYYTAFIYDSLKNQSLNSNITFENYIKFTKADCISPVTASFVFGENVQRFFPFPIASLERSKVMMSAFSKSYSMHLKSDLVDSGFLSLYYPGDDSSKFNCDIPSLFINGALAETGQRIITSNLKIKGLANFESDIDFFDKVRGHINIGTASLNCMRFPLLLSGGLIEKSETNGRHFKIGHLIDGGYRENSGLQAMYSLMNELGDLFKNKRIKPILLYIKNGSLEYDKEAENSNSAIRLLHDIGTPVTGLLNVNGTSVPAFGIVKMMEQQQAHGNPLNMYYTKVWLKDTAYHPDEKFPLGLYISDSTYLRLHKRGEKLKLINKDLVDTLQTYFR